MKKLAIIDEYNSETLQTALSLLDDNCSLKINGLNAYQLAEIEKDEPHLFERIAEKIKEDRWNPSVGMWSYSFKDISQENLIRNIVLSKRYFEEKFGKSYKVFCGKKIYNNYLPVLVYKSGFDAVVLDEEDKLYWLDGANNHRTLVLGGFDKIDVSELDADYIENNEFATYEELSAEMYSSAIDVESKKLDSIPTPMSDVEKKVNLAEKIATQNNENAQAKINECWINIFKGENDLAEKSADEIINGREYNADFVRIDREGVKILDFKFADDNSSDKILCLQELDGKEKTLRILCDEIDLGFRTEIEPYEIANYVIDKDGYVTEEYFR